MIERALLTALVAVVVLVTFDAASTHIKNSFIEIDCEIQKVEICIKEDLD